MSTDRACFAASRRDIRRPGHCVYLYKAGAGSPNRPVADRPLAASQGS